MLIIGIDAADYRIARDYYPVDHLEQDTGWLHTLPSWACLFDRNGQTYDVPRRLDRMVEADYIWGDSLDEWTIANLPIRMPTFSNGARVPRHLSKPKGLEERREELAVLGDIIESSMTKHTLVVVNGLDSLCHTCSDNLEIHDAYERVFFWAGMHDPDVIVSDHGFDDFGGRSGVEDHSKHAVVYGLDVERVTQVGPALSRIA